MWIYTSCIFFSITLFATETACELFQVSFNTRKGLYQSQDQNSSVWETFSSNCSTTTTWNQICDSINGEAKSDFSGYSVSLSYDGSTVAIGASEKFGGSDVDSVSHVRVYAKSDEDWIQLGQDIDGHGVGDLFGESVSLSPNGNVVAVGTVYDNNSNGARSGHVLVYVYIDYLNKWLQQGQELNDAMLNDQFGRSVSLSFDGKIIAIGSPHCESGDGLVMNIGCVKMYQINQTVTPATWQQIGQTLEGIESEELLGYSVSLSQDGYTVAIAALHVLPRNIRSEDELPESGFLQVYSYSMETAVSSWELVGEKIRSISTMTYDEGITSVSLSSDGKTVAFGSRLYDDGNSAEPPGRVNIYTLVDNNWIQLGQRIDERGTSDISGYSVALSADATTVIVGATAYDLETSSYMGMARVYRFVNSLKAIPVWEQIGQNIYGEEGNNDYFDTSVSVSGDGLIVTIGSPRNDGISKDLGHVKLFRLISCERTEIPSSTKASSRSSSLSLNPSLELSDVSSLDPTLSTSGSNFLPSIERSTSLSVATSLSSSSWKESTKSKTNIPSLTSTEVTPSNGMSIHQSERRTTYDPERELVSDNSTGYACLGDSTNWINLSWDPVGQDIYGEFSYDYCGTSVAMSDDGTVIAIGAPGNNNDVGDEFVGHVRVFRRIGNSWTQVGNDLDGSGAGDNYGASVSLSSDGLTAIIGSPFFGTNDNGQIRVYSYVNSLNNWTQKGQEITGERSDDNFGHSVSISDDGQIIAIGAPYNGGSAELVGFEKRGHIRIFQYNNVNASWIQMGQDLEGSEKREYSGWTVSLSADGHTLAYGGTRYGTNRGVVRVFHYNEELATPTWEQVGEDIIGGSDEDFFGISVSLSGDGSIVAAGAHLNDGGGDMSGHVRIFYYSGSSWLQRGQDIYGAAAGDESGFSVSLSTDGSFVTIGAPLSNGNGTDQGQTKVLRWSEGEESWKQVGFGINGDADFDESGSSVALSSNGLTLVVGSPKHDTGGISKGMARVYNIAQCSSEEPSMMPSSIPSSNPSSHPSISPSSGPSSKPSIKLSSSPSSAPSSLPSFLPSLTASSEPSVSPTSNPSMKPSVVSSVAPSVTPTKVPSSSPTSEVSLTPSYNPSFDPSGVASGVPSALPSVNPSSDPSSTITNTPTTDAWIVLTEDLSFSDGGTNFDDDFDRFFSGNIKYTITPDEFSIVVADINCQHPSSSISVATNVTSSGDYNLVDASFQFDQEDIQTSSIWSEGNNGGTLNFCVIFAVFYDEQKELVADIKRTSYSVEVDMISGFHPVHSEVVLSRDVPNELVEHLDYDAPITVYICDTETKEEVVSHKSYTQGSILNICISIAPPFIMRNIFQLYLYQFSATGNSKSYTAVTAGIVSHEEVVVSSCSFTICEAKIFLLGRFFEEDIPQPIDVTGSVVIEFVGEDSPLFDRRLKEDALKPFSLAVDIASENNNFLSHTKSGSVMAKCSSIVLTSLPIALIFIFFI